MISGGKRKRQVHPPKRFKQEHRAQTGRETDWNNGAGLSPSNLPPLNATLTGLCYRCLSFFFSFTHVLVHNDKKEIHTQYCRASEALTFAPPCVYQNTLIVNSSTEHNRSILIPFTHYSSLPKFELEPYYLHPLLYEMIGWQCC